MGGHGAKAVQQGDAMLAVTIVNIASPEFFLFFTILLIIVVFWKYRKFGTILLILAAAYWGYLAHFHTGGGPNPFHGVHTPGVKVTTKPAPAATSTTRR